MSGGDDHIRAFGNLPVVNTFLKYCCLILGVCLAMETVALIYLAGKTAEAKPLPIFVDNLTGVAKAVSFEAIDASGEKRSAVEIQDFLRVFIGNLYTFNKFTIRSNLEAASLVSSKEAFTVLKEYWQAWVKGDYLERNWQGLSRLKACIAISEDPDIKMQLRFERKILNERGEVDKMSDNIAICRIKPVVRTESNPHGLLILEYRESEIEVKEETDGK